VGRSTSTSIGAPFLLFKVPNIALGLTGHVEKYLPGSRIAYRVSKDAALLCAPANVADQSVVLPHVHST
jgi:hypothetical protein